MKRIAVAVVVIVLVALGVAAVGVKLAVQEGYDAVARACGLDPEAFGAELKRGRTVQEVAADHGVDAETIIADTMMHSRYRWLANVARSAGS